MTRQPSRRYALLLTLVLAGGGCSLLVDKRATQCQTDNDCAHFPNHPVCQGGVCVPSGLGPPGCFFGTPVTQQDYANQCAPGNCLAFDNCARLGLCDGGALPPLVVPGP